MLFSIKKKEKKIFGFELSDTSRSVIVGFAKSNNTELTDDQFDVISCLHDFDEVSDSIARSEVNKYIKVIRRRILICNILSFLFEAGILYTMFDLMIAYGEKRGMEKTLNSDAYKKLQEDARQALLDDMYEDCKHTDENMAVVTLNHDDGSQEFLVATMQDTDPRKGA